MINISLYLLLLLATNSAFADRDPYNINYAMHEQLLYANVFDYDPNFKANLTVTERSLDSISFSVQLYYKDSLLIEESGTAFNALEDPSFRIEKSESCGLAYIADVYSYETNGCKIFIDIELMATRAAIIFDVEESWIYDRFDLTQINIDLRRISDKAVKKKEYICSDSMLFHNKDKDYVSTFLTVKNITADSIDFKIITKIKRTQICELKGKAYRHKNKTNAFELIEDECGPDYYATLYEYKEGNCVIQIFIGYFDTRAKIVDVDNCYSDANPTIQIKEPSRVCYSLNLDEISTILTNGLTLRRIFRDY